MIFLHIPKNAGSTVETLLDPWLDASTDLHISKASTLPKNFLAAGVDPNSLLKKHSSADQIRNSMGARAFERAFSFALCRNPFARTYSAYHYVQARARKDLRNATVALNEIEQDRLNFLTRSFEDVCRDLPTVSFIHQLFLPQQSWLPSSGALSYIGRVENLAEDLGHVYGALGLPLTALANIPKQNVKTTPGEWRGMSGTCVDAIRSFYALDFDRFGYGTDPQGDDTAPVQGRGSRGELGALANGVGFRGVARAGQTSASEPMVKK
jgi:hypothetical protein